MNNRTVLVVDESRRYHDDGKMCSSRLVIRPDKDYFYWSRLFYLENFDEEWKGTFKHSTKLLCDSGEVMAERDRFLEPSTGEP